MPAAPKASPVSLTQAHAPRIIEVAKAEGVLRNQLAYILATARWETAHTMEPVEEAFWLSDDWRRRNLRYYPHHGRGFVQITWPANYGKADKELGLGGRLIANPDLALDAEIAARILVRGMMQGWFTSKKLGDYVTLAKSDFVNARRVVNGTDKAGPIAALAEHYDDLLTEAGYGVVATPIPAPAPGSPPSVTPPTPDDPGALMAQAIALLHRAVAALNTGA